MCFWGFASVSDVEIGVSSNISLIIFRDLTSFMKLLSAYRSSFGSRSDYREAESAQLTNFLLFFILGWVLAMRLNLEISEKS